MERLGERVSRRVRGTTCCVLCSMLCVILVSKIAPNIYVSKYTFSALTCIIT